MKKTIGWAFAGALVLAGSIFAYAQGSNTSPLLNDIGIALSPNEQNQSADITTAATGDLFLFLDVSETPDSINYGDGTDVLVAAGVTSTVAELNIMDGVTATFTEINLIDGVTATTAELNIVDGVTASAAEINLAADESANVEILTGADVLTAAQSGTTLFYGSATGAQITLPAKALGLRFTIIMGSTPVTTTNVTVIPNASDDNTIFGNATVNGASVPAADAEGVISFVANSALPGDWVELMNDGVNWYVTGQGNAAGAITFTT